MRRLQLFTALLLALASGLVLTTSAVAYNVGAVYRDCNAHGKLTGHYSRAELQAALNQMPSEVAEYSACANIIQQALLGASAHGGHGATGSQGTTTGGSTGGGTGGGTGGSGPKSGATGKAGGSTATNGGGSDGTGSLGGIRAASTSAGGSLPAPLIVVLVLLALTALSGAGVAIRRRVVARHGT